MNKEDFIKVINGEIFYKNDYCYWLYNQLEDRDNKIKKAIEYIEKYVDNECIYKGMLKKHYNKDTLLSILRGDSDE